MKLKDGVYGYHRRYGDGAFKDAPGCTYKPKNWACGRSASALRQQQLNTLVYMQLMRRHPQSFSSTLELVSPSSQRLEHSNSSVISRPPRC